MNGYIHITAPDPLAPKTSPFFLEVTWPTRGSGMVGFDPDGVVSIEEGPVAIRFESTGRALLWLFHVTQIIRDEDSKREALADEEDEAK